MFPVHMQALPLLWDSLGTVCVPVYTEVVPEAASLSHCCTILSLGEQCWRLLAHLPLETKLAQQQQDNSRGDLSLLPRLDNGCSLIPSLALH